MTTLAAITLTTPAMLLGMALVGLPVLAHLMFRRARRKVTFPTIRLLAEATATQSRLFYMRRWILLALRCLAVLLIAWAFARPVWVDARGADAAGQGATVVLVLDVSASSDQHTVNGRVIDEMAAKAGRVLDELTPGVDFATIVYARRSPLINYPEPIANLAALRDELANLEPTRERADLSAAIAEAAAILVKQPGDRRLVILSDMQRDNWADLSVDADALREAGIETTVLEVGARALANLALTQPRIDPPRPIAGRPAAALVTVDNHSADEQTVAVHALLDGRPLGTRRVIVPAGSSAVAAFDIAIAEARRHALTFEIDPDALNADNRAYLTVDAAERVSVVVVSDDDPADPTASSYFITRALAPLGGERDALDVRHLTSDRLSGEALGTAEAVIIGDIGRLGAAHARALANAIAEGRGVVWFACDGPVDANLAALADAAGDPRILPWRAAAVRRVGRGADPLYLARGAFQSPPLNAFDDAAQLALARVPLYRAHHTTGRNDDAFHILRFADGEPALSVTRYGDGRWALANFGVAPRCGELGKRGLFVALLHALVDHVRPDADRAASPLVGDMLTFSGPDEPGVTLTVSGPDDEPPAVRRSTEDGVTRLQIGPVRDPGFYTVQRDNRPLRAFAVNLDERESDLARIDPARLTERFGGASEAVRVIGADGRSDLQTGGRPLWPWLIVAAMGALACEMTVLSVWRR